MVHEAGGHHASDNIEQNVANENAKPGEPMFDLEIKPLELQQAHLEEYRTYIDTHKNDSK